MKAPAVSLLAIALSVAPLAGAASAEEPPVSAAPVVVEGTPVPGGSVATSRVDAAATAPVSGATISGVAAGFANLDLSTSGVGSFNDTLSLRGFTNTPIFGDPAVTVYLDEVPLGSTFTSPTELPGIASVELHRGPGQGTLFGAAGSAGVLQLLTPSAPSGGTLGTSAGSDGLRAVSASAAGTAGAVSAWVSAAYRKQDGFLQDTALGRKIDGRETSTGLARVNVKPGAGPLELSLVADVWRARDGEQPLVPLGGPWFSVSRAAAGETHIDAANLGLTASTDASWGRVSATTSFNDWRMGPYREVLDFGPAELLNDATVHQRAVNEELRFASAKGAATTWQAGAFVSGNRTEGAFRRAFGPYVMEQSDYVIDGRELAAFGQAEREVAPGLRAGLGLRVETVRKTLLRTQQAPQVDAFGLAERSSALLPKATLRYSPSARTELFATAEAGYKPGGYSGFTGNRALAAFGPERSWGGQAGGRLRSAGGTLEATLRGFAYEITGYQIERSFATHSISDDYLVVNAPRARTLGAELELAWKPLAGLSVSAAAGVTQARLERFTDPYTGISYAGKTPPYVAPFNGSFSIDYRPAGGWFVGAGLVATGRTYYTEAEALQFGQRARALVSARAGYDAGRWRVTVLGDNLTDVRYYRLISPGTGHGSPGDPRTWAVEATMRY